MRTLRDLLLNRLTVGEDSDLSSVLTAMQRSGASAAAVVSGGGLRGIVTVEAAVLSEPDLPVREVMRAASTRLSADEPVRQAAKTFVHQQADHLAVYDGEEFLGLLSALMLITELGRSWDPLTGLSWSDRLRDWGVECLEAGQEISIVFFDLDDFGLYNKRFGHTVGDLVLRGFAKLLGGVIDPSRDVLVRYGGDEFAIGTTRSRGETQALLANLSGREFQVAGVGAAVGYSFGVSGGKRTHEPSRDHVAATLDNLIGLASRACLANKPGGALVGEPGMGELVSRGAVSLDGESLLSGLAEIDAGPVVSVSGSGESGSSVQIFAGGASGAGSGRAGLSGVVEAALSAAGSVAPEVRVTVSDVLFVGDDGGKRVVVSGVRTQGASTRSFEVSRPLGESAEESLAEAVVGAALG